MPVRIETRDPLPIIVLAATLITGCAEEQCAAACGDFEGVAVELTLGISTSYDVDMELDGAPGSFTCQRRPDSAGHSMDNVTGSVPITACQKHGFEILSSPTWLTISVAAQDGSWIGSFDEALTYERRNVCGNLCPPSATVALPASACTNESDQNEINDPDFETSYEACIEQTRQDSSSLASCLQEEPPGLSIACSICYEFWEGCYCPPPCVVTGCLKELEECSGLAEPFPASG